MEREAAQDWTTSRPLVCVSAGVPGRLGSARWRHWEEQQLRRLLVLECGGVCCARWPYIVRVPWQSAASSGPPSSYLGRPLVLPAARYLAEHARCLQQTATTTGCWRRDS